MSNGIPIDILEEHIQYDPISGILRSITSRGNIKKGSIIGTDNGAGYLQFVLLGKTLYCHRIAFILTYGKFPETVDHINRNPRDNRIANLREASITQNNWNSIKTHKKGKYRGAYQRGNRWESVIRDGKKQIYLGRFDTEKLAAEAYDVASKRIHGEFGVPNFG